MSWNSYEIDKHYAIGYYTEGWPKDANEKISFLYSNLSIPSTKDCFFLNEKIYKFCNNSLNECLVQLKKKYWPQFMDPIDNKDSQDKIVISEARNEIKKNMQELYQYMYCLPTNFLFGAGLRHNFHSVQVW